LAQVAIWAQVSVVSASDIVEHLIPNEVRMECIFFDCDDCLYKNSWATASRLNDKFREYCQIKLGVPECKMLELYRTYGTTLCGLIREGHIPEEQVQDFLASVHDVPLDDDIHPDTELRKMLEALPQRRWVFTAATREHAERCLRCLGIEDLFDGIVACSSPQMLERAGYVSKHDRLCFEAAMDMAGVARERAAGCMLLDDSVTNLETARTMGWRTVLVGLHKRDGSQIDTSQVDFAVETLHELRKVVPSLFGGATAGAATSLSQKANIAAGEKEALPMKRGRREVKPCASSPERRVLRKRQLAMSPEQKQNVSSPESL